MAPIGPGPRYNLPSTIGYEKHDQRYARMPQYSFGSRTQSAFKSITPGPGYNTFGCTRFGPSKSFISNMASTSFDSVSAKDRKKVKSRSSKKVKSKAS